MKKTLRLIVLCFAVLLVLSFTHGAQAVEPASVTIAGDLQNELGCPGDWQPDCAATHLTYDASDAVWQGTFTIPAGNWQYKAALNDSWNENYGANAIQNGANISLTLPGAASVKFYYDNATHWVTSNQNSVIAVAPGDFQSELGCPGDWDPGCLRSWLQDPDGDGIYTFSAVLPAGNYQAKVAINESWDENYGAGGAPGGANIPFTVPSNGKNVSFSYDANSHILTVTVACNPDLTPPLVSCPANITKESTACTGEVVTYIASAADDCGLTSFQCSPPPGSTFPVGITTVTCTAVNVAGLSASCSFTVTVKCNQCPTADPLSVTVDQDSTVNFQLPGSDQDGDPLQYSITQPPAHGVLVLQIQTGAASYSPNAGYIGPDSFKYKVNDGKCDSAEATVSISVADTTPPDVTIITPQANVAVQDGVTFQAEVTDASGIDKVFFYLREADGGDGIPIGYEDLDATYNSSTGYWEYPFDTTVLQDGYYVILAKAIDSFDNEGWSDVVPFSIRNWAVITKLPSTPNSKAGRTMPVKFSLRIAASVDPAQPFVYNEDLEIRIYRCNNNSCSSRTLMQTSVYGTKPTNYKIDVTAELYQTNFQTTKTPAQYLVEIWRPTKNFLAGSFTFKTVK